MANKNLSGLTSLLKRLRPHCGTRITCVEPQVCSWSRVKSLHTSCRAVAAAPVSPAVSPTEAKLKEPVTPDRLIWKLEVHCQGHDKAVMQSYAKFLHMTCQHLGLNAEKAVHGTATHERMTLLKSVHIQGKHRVQYEMQTYPLDLTVFHVTGSTADTFLEYIQRMCPEGILMRVTEHALNKFPASMMQVLTEARARNRGATEVEKPVAEAGSATEEARGAAVEAKKPVLEAEVAETEAGKPVTEAGKPVTEAGNARVEAEEANKPSV